MSPIGVIVNGAAGKMGQVACDMLRTDPAFELLAGLGRTDDLAQAIIDMNAHVVVDLTRADSAYKNSRTIIEQGACPVIGTSGLLEPEIEVLSKLCDEQKLGGLIVPNFSIAAVLMMRFSAQAAHYLPDVEIIEAHHPGKAEAPSGTAIKTADLIAKVRQESPLVSTSQEILPGALGAQYQDVRIHSLRLPGTLAEQNVMFGQTGETLTIRHQTMDRISFMPGLRLACQTVQTLNGLVYGLDHIL
ncbi:MAG: 4-hydroxy-tetrahydrodipicolinate reductase [Legionellaceae bacterium]|nr:4-hydroxy-tetrahydrodipicolinate reductase [Legionellaceae bacterium]